jgi:hypothetical protein
VAARLLALAAIVLALAAPADADYIAGQIALASQGNSSDRNTLPPAVTQGERFTILVSTRIPEGSTLNPIPILTGRIDALVPDGIDFIAARVSSIGKPLLLGLSSIDLDPTPGDNVNADGSGRDAALAFGPVFNIPDDPSDSTNDFAVFAFDFVARLGSTGPFLVEFEFRTDGVLRGEAGVSVQLADPSLKASMSITPNEAIEVETPFEVKTVVTYAGSAFPTIYDLETDIVLARSFDASKVQASSVPDGYSLLVLGNTPSSGLSTVRFRPSTNLRVQNNDVLTFAFKTQIRRDVPVPFQFVLGASASARSVETPFPVGFAATLAVAVTAGATTADVDQDGLTNSQEARAGTDSLDADMDDDGVADGDEASALQDLDGDGLIGVRDPDSDGDGLLDGIEQGVTAPVPAGAGFRGTDTRSPNLRIDRDPRTTTSARVADTDGDRIPDGVEDRNRNGRKDFGELDPNDPLDTQRKATDLPDADGDGVADIFEDVDQDGVVDVADGETDPSEPSDGVLVVDTDGDGVPDVVERFYGLDPDSADKDSDDDGVLDLEEPAGFDDVDGDGRIGILDRDSDNDGIPDGVEEGVTLPSATTDADFFTPDADPTTKTSSVIADTDGDGLPDGFEDLNRNGKVDAGETDPDDPGDAGSIPENVLDSDQDGIPDKVEIEFNLNPNDADADDDGVRDGDEPGALVDTDGDGKIGARDADSDNDGLPDGLEMGVTAPVPAGPGFRGTDPGRGFVRDLDPATTTNPLLEDTDGDGFPDGFEDPSHDGAVGPLETDSSNSEDGGSVPELLVDSDGDGIPDLVEQGYGLDPLAVDADNDGIADGDEVAPLSDTDGDGRPNVIDADADNDGLADGTEAGVTEPVPDPDGDGPLRGTDPDSPSFKPAAQPASPANPVNDDADGDGVNDRFEDVNGNGRLDPGETSSSDSTDADSIPANRVDTDQDGVPDVVEMSLGLDPADLDADDDGVPDGEEPGRLTDNDGDGLIGALDPDSDDDGVLDGTELGITVGVTSSATVKGTAPGSPSFRPDLDPSTRTNPLDPDSDGDGKPDGFEDLNGNGRKDFAETDPLAVEPFAPEAIRVQGGSCAAAGPHGAGEAAGALVPWAALLALLLAGRRGRRRLEPRAAGAAGAAGTAMSQVRHPMRPIGQNDRSIAAGALSVALALVVASAARADSDGFDARTFRPNPDSLGIHSVRGPDVLGPLALAFGLHYDHSGHAVELANSSGRRRAGVVDSMDALSLAGAIGLPFDLEVAASVPYVVYERASPLEDPGRHFHGRGFGDVLIEGKWLALAPREWDAAVALEAFCSIPSGDEDRFRGEGRVSAGAYVLAEQRLFDRLRLLGEVGYEWVDGATRFGGIERDDRVRLAGGIGFMIFRSPGFLKKVVPPSGERKPPRPSPKAFRLDLEASVDAAFRAEKPSDELTFPVEVYSGVRLDTPLDVSLTLGGSFSVADGAPASEWRVFLGVSFAFGGAPARRAFPGFTRGRTSEEE